MPHRYLLVLLLAFCLLAMVYSLATPLFEAPDEPWHYAYVRWLAEGHGLPRLDDDASGAYQEVAQPPLYYVTAALVSSPVPDDDLLELFWHNPQFGYQAGGTINDNKNMLIHTDVERFPWRNAVLAVRVARLVSLVFGLVAVGATYGLVREALPRHPALALVAAGVVAFTPQFLFISGVVSNDSAAAATCACALWALARIIRLGPTLRRAGATGLALGLAFLSKTSGLLLLPMALLALGFGRRRTTAGFGDKQGEEIGDRSVWYEISLMLGLATVVGGWWYLRNWILFDDPLGLSAHVNTPWARTEPVSLGGLLSELPQVFRSFWGAFGWGHVELSGYLYWILGLLMGLAFLGWVLYLVRLRRTWAGFGLDSEESAVKSGQKRAASAMTGIFVLAAGWCVAVLLALLRWMWQVGAPHGRLLFPALGAWGLLLTVGWSGLSAGRFLLPAAPSQGDPTALSSELKEGRITFSLPLLFVVSLFVLSLVAPFMVIRPAFAPPRMLSPAEAAKRVKPQALVFGDRARLLGYQVEPESVAAGESAKVTLCWEALRSMEQDYTLFIHLLGRDNLRVAERTTYPGQGRYPTSLWRVGRAFCDSYWLDVAPWAATPELYSLEVGLYDAETGWRLPPRDAAGQAVEPPVVGWVRVLPAASPPRPEHLLSYDLGGQIALVGYESSPDLADDSPTKLVSSQILTLTLYWQALQPPQGDYTVFVHLLDERGTLVTQDDGLPREGRYPTWAWQPGDLVPDSHTVTLPDERPPGPYRWSVGMYQAETKERLPIIGPEGPLPDGAILLGEAGD